MSPFQISDFVTDYSGVLTQGELEVKAEDAALRTVTRVAKKVLRPLQPQKIPEPMKRPEGRNSPTYTPAGYKGSTNGLFYVFEME